MTMWQTMETAPRDREVLLWFPDGPFACPAKWELIEGGNDDGEGNQWGWIIADDLSEQHDGVVWEDSHQPALWTEIPPPAEQEKKT